MPAKRAFFQLLRRASALSQGIFSDPAKKSFLCRIWPIFGHFWCPVVTLVTFCNLFVTLKRIQKSITNSKRIFKNPTKKNVLKELRKYFLYKKQKNKIFLKKVFNFFIMKKNNILLVFLYQEDVILPELSSPVHCRVRGGTLSGKKQQQQEQQQDSITSF